MEGSPVLCFEFAGELSVGFEDYIDGVPESMLSKKAVVDALRDEFRRHVVIKILRTLSGARVVDVTDYHIVLEQTERTEIICVRVTPAEKERLRKGAGGEGPEPSGPRAAQAPRPKRANLFFSPPLLYLTPSGA
ncbi:hypothetical protein [Infirmifilum sp. NZ]|uniref:hypothetical protein n=1 Tax=Infirmifilum sp. NZ TaxID=2926850 RepID=UPI0027AB86A2|nr:hypothetical protein [Infirmifilum sp. NZ]UNQ73654.1 hypothetical protein MOV14_01230 [Infirmifilum sp. NZ]